MVRSNGPFVHRGRILKKILGVCIAPLTRITFGQTVLCICDVGAVGPNSLGSYDNRPFEQARGIAQPVLLNITTARLLMIAGDGGRAASSDRKEIIVTSNCRKTRQSLRPARADGAVRARSAEGSRRCASAPLLGGVSIRRRDRPGSPLNRSSQAEMVSRAATGNPFAVVAAFAGDFSSAEKRVRACEAPHASEITTFDVMPTWRSRLTH